MSTLLSLTRKNANFCFQFSYILIVSFWCYILKFLLVFYPGYNLKFFVAKFCFKLLKQSTENLCIPWVGIPPTSPRLSRQWPRNIRRKIRSGFSFIERFKGIGRASENSTVACADPINHGQSVPAKRDKASHRMWPFEGKSRWNGFENEIFEIRYISDKIFPPSPCCFWFICVCARLTSNNDLQQMLRTAFIFSQKGCQHFFPELENLNWIDIIIAQMNSGEKGETSRRRKKSGREEFPIRDWHLMLTSSTK